MALLISCILLLTITFDFRVQCETEKSGKILRRVTTIVEDYLLSEKSELAALLKTPEFPKHCKDVQDEGNTESGIYHIQPLRAPEPFPVLCNLKSTGGGWTYILNRFDGSQDFYLDWSWYKHGFGNIAKEFWLGLEKTHLLTGFENNELLIELEDWEGDQKHAFYGAFGIGSEDEGYNLKILSGYNGTAGDSFSNEAGMRFTTKDKDLDVSVGENCAVFSNAAWWYRDCKHTHLTGKYFVDNDSGSAYLQGIYWVGWHGNKYSLKAARMMVRPR